MEFFLVIKICQPLSSYSLAPFHLIPSLPSRKPHVTLLPKAGA
nr:MAG TPA: hypothetical protein [Caudoviricetes sp.]